MYLSPKFSYKVRNTERKTNLSTHQSYQKVSEVKLQIYPGFIDVTKTL